MPNRHRISLGRIGRLLAAGAATALLSFGAGRLIAGEEDGASGKPFRPPGAEARKKAIGSTEGLPETLRRALDPGGDFDPIPEPGASDWLANHEESGQTFDDFKSSKPNRPDAARKVIYLLPLGDLPKEKSPAVETLREFMGLYFGLEARTLDPIDLSKEKITNRINPNTKHSQLLTDDLLDLLKKRLPKDAYCLLGITVEDLYPDPSWNFVFGQAALFDRVGVQSFARYDPAFFGDERGKGYEGLIVRRSLGTLAHETAHMFGLQHCVFFTCQVNGSNHQAESDSRPLRECPMCLRKLQWSIGFDAVERYRRLQAFFEKEGLWDEAEWIRKRLPRVTGEKEEKSKKPPVPAAAPQPGEKPVGKDPAAEDE